MITPTRGFSSFRHASVLFTISGVLLLGAILGVYIRQNGWFDQALTIRMIVPSSQGLRPGTPVRLSGLRIGVLDRLRLLPDGRVELKLRVPERYRPWVSPKSIAWIGRDGLLGDALIELTAAPMPEQSVPSTFQVDTRFSPDVDSLLTGLEATRGDLQRLVVSSTRVTDREIPSALAQLRNALASGTSVTRTLDREIPPTAAQLRAMIGAAQGTVTAAEGTVVSVGRSVREVSPDLREALLEFSKVMRRTDDLLNKFTYLLQSVPDQDEPATQQPAPTSPHRRTD